MFVQERRHSSGSAGAGGANASRMLNDSRSHRRRSNQSSDASHGDEKNKGKTSSNQQGQPSLLEKDINALFSGAPYFLLERGKHRHWYPQVIFPWDEHDASIQKFLDRKPLPHSSHTLATLHAHLPIPDGWYVKGDTPVGLSDWRRTGAPKRATFDIGVFEVPNMLSMNGKEPGSVGFRYFLELPIADAVRYTGPPVPKKHPELQDLSKIPSTQAFAMMDHYNDPYFDCKDGTVHDRKKLLCEGPAAWKRIGLREINLKTMVNRLEKLRETRNRMLYGGGTDTILDIESERELYNVLFSKFLHPPPRSMRLGDENPHDLKSQINVLTTVLATPGAWLDFSLVEWRCRVGQVLWEAPPHLDGDCLGPSLTDDSGSKPWVNSSLERKWLLIQLLLSGELLLRLDAIVRRGILQHTRGMDVSNLDVHTFDKLRTGKVNWDLVAVRRLFDSFDISLRPPSVDGNPAQDTQSQSPEKRRHLAFFENLSNKISNSKAGTESAWDCRLSPVHIQQQLTGLFVFAENVEWPDFDGFKRRLESKLKGESTTEIPSSSCEGPIQSTLTDDAEGKLEEDSMYSRSTSRRLVVLGSQKQANGTTNTTGWITRSWLSGFVLPGASINHILMAATLENDPEAMGCLGPVINLHGGFSYKGRSWWSKECIVGRVLAGLENSLSSMGWLSNPVVPYNASTSESLENRWYEVLVKEPPPRSKRPRVRQGNTLAEQSTPLGVGEMTMGAFSLPADEQDTWPSSEIRFKGLGFTPKSEEQPGRRQIIVSKETYASFDFGQSASEPTTTISFPLTYNTRFIASHECRPPLGLASSRLHPLSSLVQNKDDTSLRHSHLPGHPLHKIYKYRYVPIASLPETGAPKRPPAGKDEVESSRHEVIIIDARGSHERETFARAWCASVGCHAIIGRVGRTCIACCIREAHALDVDVIIRVGDEVQP